MSFLETLVLLIAGLELTLAAANCCYFGGYARRTPLASRRAGALALALVSGAMALEGGFYVLRGVAPLPAGSLRLLAELAVRLVLLSAVAAVSTLIWRGRRLLR